MRINRRIRLDPVGWLETTRIIPVRQLRWLLLPLARLPAVQFLLLDPMEGLRRHAPLGIGRLAVRAQRRRQRRNLARLQAAGNPLVSVIVPAHNAAATLDGAVTSLLRQSYQALEILIVDDISEDDTAQVAARLAQADGRVRLLSAPEHLGAALARNMGLAAARGVYLTFQDADDYSLPGRIERQLVPLLGTQGHLASLCAYCRVDDQGRPLRVNGEIYRKRTTSLLFARKPVLERMGGMAPLLRGEDSEYLSRFRAAFGRQALHVLYAPLYEARFSEDSLLWSDSQVRRQGDEIHYDVAETAPAALADYEDWHRRIAAGEASPHLALARKRDDPPAGRGN
ncbi:MAG: glycosyltransferase family 2 protein [Kiloniellales bacterium]